MVDVPMKRVMAYGSHFKLIVSTKLDEFNIVQIWPEKIYDNKDGYPVFLCEVLDQSNKESEK